MTDTELKRQRIENLVKIGGLGLVGFLVAPFVFLAIQGLIGLVVAAAISWGVINFLPWFGMKMANWRLKAIKAEAMKNPVETLQNEYNEKVSALKEFQNQLATFMAEVADFADDVKQFVKEGLDEDGTYQQQLADLQEAVERRHQMLLDGQEDVTEFAQAISRAEKQWKMACAAARMQESAGQIEGDVFDKICIDTALTSIKTKMNKSFADIKLSFSAEQMSARKRAAAPVKSLVNAEQVNSPIPPRQPIAIS